MSRILYVSKAVEPPWNDSSKNLVKDLATHLSRHDALVMSHTSGPGKFKVYSERAPAFAPGLISNLRVLTGLSFSTGTDIWHYFFAPNPRTSTVSRFINRARRKPSVHTVCSAPKVFDRDVLFADVTVVLSEQTEQGFLDAGVPSERLRRIPPCIPHVTTSMDTTAARNVFGLPKDAQVALFAGDLEFGGGAERSLQLLRENKQVHLAMACRAKTPAATKVRSDLQARLSPEDAARVTWIGETSHIYELLDCVDVMLFPVTDLYAKMDYPLVLLEAMQLGTPVVAAKGTPAAELDAFGAKIVDADDVAGVTAELLDSTTKLAAAALAAKEGVDKRFSPGAMAQKYEALYDELV